MKLGQRRDQGCRCILYSIQDSLFSEYAKYANNIINQKVCPDFDEKIHFLIYL